MMVDKRCGKERVETLQEIKEVTCLWDGFASAAKDKIKFMGITMDIKCLWMLFSESSLYASHCSTHNSSTIIGLSNACKVSYSTFLELLLNGVSDRASIKCLKLMSPWICVALKLFQHITEALCMLAF